MKNYILVVCLVMVGCGGAEKADIEIDRELCEAQGGEAQLLDVVNVDTGDRRYEIECVFEKQPSHAICKPYNGFGGECPEI